MGGPIRVMILDDEAHVRENLAAFFDDEGFSVITAADAEIALALLQNSPVDICIVDIRLPGIDGETFIRRASQQWPGLRFIIHTGSPSYHFHEKMNLAGIQPEHVFRKPVTDMVLIADAIRTIAGGNG